MSTRKRPNKGPSTTTKTTTGPRPATAGTSNAPRPANGASRPVSAKPSANGSRQPAVPAAKPASNTRPASSSSRAGAAPKAAIAASKRPTSWVSAAIRAFPYIGAAYVIFLAAIEAGGAIPVIVGIVALVFAVVGLAGRFSSALSENANYTQMQTTVASWIGEFTSVIVACAALGFGLLSWALWHAKSTSFFSWLSIVALVVALALIVRASYLRKEA